jgi:hypothetical protein
MLTKAPLDVTQSLYTLVQSVIIPLFEVIFNFKGVIFKPVPNIQVTNCKFIQHNIRQLILSLNYLISLTCSD